MTKAEAVEEAVKLVEEMQVTRYVMRRGKNYKVSVLGYDNGYTVAEMIGPGNVQNYKV